MGRGFVAAMQQSDLWEVSAVYDINPAARQLARHRIPGAAVYEVPEPIFADPGIDVVGLFTLADARPRQIREALATRKHVLAEKPLAADVVTEWQLVRDIEASDRFVAVNLFNRNAWYHKDIRQFIADNQIGDVAVIRICHMTPGHMPMEGTTPRVHPFTTATCTMSTSSSGTPTASTRHGTRKGFGCGDTKIPGGCHGTFENGIVFDITQGFIYGHLAKQQPHNRSVDVIGTKGVD